MDFRFGCCRNLTWEEFREDMRKDFQLALRKF